MSENSSKQDKKSLRQEKSERKLTKKNWWYLLLLPVWTYAAFWLAQLLILAVTQGLMAAGVPIDQLNPVLLSTVLSAVVYSVALVLVIGLPYRIWRRRTTFREMGVTDYPSWMDILITPAAFVVYFICSGILMAIATQILPIDLNQAQQLPFSQSTLGSQIHYILAFITLVILAPIAEELLFRGYLYGKLRSAAPIWLAIIITSLTFGAAHLWTGPGNELQWAVMVDTFALSIIMCIAREYTGAIWVSILMHMAKNGLAFYLLFVNPSLVDQLKAAILPFL